MASQARPWRRLPSMVRAPAPVPADPSPAAPPARPPAAVPAFGAASPPPPPEPRPQRELAPPPPAAAAASTVSVPSIPVSRPVAAVPVLGSLSSLPPSPARGTSPPAVTKPQVMSPGGSAPTSPIQSRNGLSTSSPLPPPPRPPPSIQATTVVVPVPAPMMVSRHEKKYFDSEEAGARVITIAGENRGAVMELLVRSPKTGSFPHQSSDTGNKKEQESSGSSGGERKQKTKEGTLKSKASLASPPAPVTAFMNSNVQGINNSIVFNSSFTHHDPGIHLSFSRNPSKAN